MILPKPDDSAQVDVQPPAWFVSFQQQMGRLLRTPLDTKTGQFRATVEHYPQSLVADVRDDGPGALARLELYHEQYWRRLFNTLQDVFPRAARVLGYFRFNAVVSQFLVEHPPKSFDLANASEGFFNWFMRRLDDLIVAAKVADVSGKYRVIETPVGQLARPATNSPLANVLAAITAPWSLLVQALHVDEAERRALRLPYEPIWQPMAGQRAALLIARPIFAASFSLARQDYDLPVGKIPADWVLNTERRKAPLHLIIIRAPRGIATHPVDPIFARMLALAHVLPLDAALERTEKALTGALLAHWQRSVDEYIDSALKNGFWVGYEMQQTTIS